MPSGRTHDRITLWSLPLVAGLSFGLTLSGNLTLLVLSGFLFSGLMFGPDLDIHSRQYVRWGWLRWIWIPYQKGLRHRSIFSHGPILGTILRLLYLACWLGAIGVLVLGVAQVVWGVEWKWQIVVAAIQKSLFGHPHEWLALFLGLELGAMSHALSDWGGSAYKRFKKGGLKALMLGAAKSQRRKSTKGRLQKKHRRDASTAKPQAKRPPRKQQR